MLPCVLDRDLGTLDVPNESAHLAQPPSMQLYTKISIGLVLGAVVGVAVNVTGVSATPAWTEGIVPVLDFVGRAFIRLITMIVIPLVVASLMMGVASLGDIRKLGRIGGKTVGYYMATTAPASARW
jgi:proton glutamate symport protein